MPGKSRHGRGRQLPQSKKKKSGLGRKTMPVQPTTVAQTAEPVFRPVTPVPSARVQTPAAKLATIQYPYIVTELRTIGVLAGIMLAILIVLALVLQ